MAKRKFIKGIYASQEKKDEQDFQQFIDTFQLHNKFALTGATEQACFYDAISIGNDGSMTAIEFKERKKGTDRYGDCFIEPTKYRNLRDKSEKEGMVTLYINFMGDGTDVYMFPIQLINESDTNWHPDVWIDGGYEDRIGLPWEYAYHYYLDENGNRIIKRPVDGKDRKINTIKLKPTRNETKNMCETDRASDAHNE